MMYIQENNEIMPGTDFWSVVDGASGKILVCPTAGKKVARAYAYNVFAANKGLGEIPSPELICLTADANAELADGLMAFGEDVDFRHAGGAIASYIDGHVVYSKEIPVLAMATTSMVSGMTAGVNLGYLNSNNFASDTTAIVAGGFVPNEGVSVTVSEGVCSFYFGNNLSNVKIFEGGDADKNLYTGNYLGVRASGSNVNKSTLAKIDLAPAAGTTSKGFILSAEKAFSFMDYSSSINQKFSIEFLSGTTVVATLSASNESGSNVMRLSGGSTASVIMKSITVNQGDDIDSCRYNFLYGITKNPQFFQLDGTPLSIILYDNKVACIAGGKSAVIDIVAGDYKNISKVVFTTDGQKSSLCLLEPNFDQIY